MKRLVATLLISILAVQHAVASVLITPSFVVVISERCQEGDVACNDVVYTGVNKKTGQSISLKGQVWSRMCADRVTPCEHIGWKFKSGKVTYSVVEATAELQVEDEHKVLLQEKGKWID